MKTYRFTAKVSEQGIIQVPYNPSLFEGEVEVALMPKTEWKATKFLEKWGGFLSDQDADLAKHEHLSTKYQ
ncbi:MAG: hypothetical protein WBA23_20440 [Tunicatimonas sp.]|uniref:hypothetical protein n=1 Tax=Tunicatimonas sp. TaxID=1940096 RepID=UPI003C78F2B3